MDMDEEARRAAAQRSRFVQNALVEAVVDGRLVIVHGVSRIAAVLGISKGATKTALLQGRVERAWQVGKRWHAIRPVLLASAPELPFTADPQNGDDQ